MLCRAETPTLWLRVRRSEAHRVISGLESSSFPLLAVPKLSSGVCHKKTEFQPVRNLELVMVVNATNEIIDPFAFREDLRFLSGEPERYGSGSAWSEKLGHWIARNVNWLSSSALRELIQQLLVLNRAYPISSGVIGFSLSSLINGTRRNSRVLVGQSAPHLPAGP
jgi:hypothetical protein